MKTIIKSIYMNEKQYLFDGTEMELFEINDKEEYKNYINKKEDKKLESYIKENELAKIVLNISNSCNLNCQYCYADGGNYNRCDDIMSEETFEKIIENLKERKIKRINVVSFFGGEPLINAKLIKRALERLEQEFVIDNYELVTNGQLLNKEIMEYIIKYNVSLSLSCDGPEDITDLLRGKGVYKKVQEGILLCKEMNYSNVTISVTYTGEHERLGYSMQDISDFFKEQGLRITLTKVITNNEKLMVKHILTEQEVREDMRESLENIENNDITGKINPFLYSILLSLIYKSKTVTFCDDLHTGRTISFDYNGDIYNCFRLWNESKYKINGEEKVSEYLEDYNCKEKYNMCKKCWAKNICKVCIVSILQNQNQFPFKLDYCSYKKMYEIALEEIIGYIEKNNMDKIVKNFNTSFLKYSE